MAAGKELGIRCSPSSRARQGTDNVHEREHDDPRLETVDGCLLVSGSPPFGLHHVIGDTQALIDDVPLLRYMDLRINTLASILAVHHDVVEIFSSSDIEQS